jgi:hypothetical protein
VDDGSPLPDKRVGTRPAKRGGAAARGGQPVDPRTEGQVVDGTGGTRRPPRPGAVRSTGVPRLASPFGERATPIPPPLEGSTTGIVDAAPLDTTDSYVDLHESLPTALPVIVPATVDDEPDDQADDQSGDQSGRTSSPEAFVPAVPAGPPTVALPTVMPPPSPEYTDTDGTGGLPSLTKPKRPSRALKPVVMPKRRPRVRRVTRVVRHVDSWSVFKVALVFNLFMYFTCLTAGVLLWQVAQNTGTVDNVQRFFESFGWKTFELKGGQIYHNSWVAGLFLVVGVTGLMVLMATLFNLITDLVGGIRVSVLEEEVVARDDRGLGWRRARRAQAAAAAAAERPSSVADQPAVLWSAPDEAVQPD